MSVFSVHGVQRAAAPPTKQLDFDSLHISLEVSSNFRLVKVVLSS